jgi:peptidoglycan-associated lipoprotein
MRRLSLVLVLSAAFVLAGCPKAQKKDETPQVNNAAVSDENMLGDSDSGKAMGLQTIHFPFDSFDMDSTAKSTASANADILKAKPSVKVQIEGHCDERGGIQYNIALGEKRANAVKKYLEDLGVAGDRISTISYGKEKPIDPGHTEEAWAKNRRANFSITSK